jgi:hypothetical protein
VKMKRAVRKQKEPVQDELLYAGGDAGNRTRVRKIRPRVYYKLSRPFDVAWGAPNDRLRSRPADPLLCALSASRAQHPSLYDAQTPWHRGSPEVDVTPVYGVRVSN